MFDRLKDVALAVYSNPKVRDAFKVLLGAIGLALAQALGFSPF